MILFSITLLLLTVATIAGIFWLAGFWERGRPTNEALGVPPEILRDLDHPKQ